MHPYSTDSIILHSFFEYKFNNAYILSVTISKCSTIFSKRNAKVETIIFMHCGNAKSLTEYF